jgi:hypothetical protein
MATGEFWYLMFVIAAFGVFAVSMSAAVIEYKMWLRRTRVHRQATSSARRIDGALSTRRVP